MKPTTSTDQSIAIEVLKRHCRRDGYVKVLERVEGVGAEEDGPFEVCFPEWVHELIERFEELYGPDEGQAVYVQVVEWLIREVFKGHTAVSFQ